MASSIQVPPSIGLSDIIDGTSNTLLASEGRVHRAYFNSGGCCSDNEDAYTSGAERRRRAHGDSAAGAGYA